MAVFPLIVVGFVWVYLGQLLKRLLNQNRLPKWWALSVPVLIGLLFINNPFLSIKTGVFIGMMVFIATYDYQTKTIPRFVHLIVLLIGCIDVNVSWIINQALPGLLLLPLPVMGVYWYQKRKEPGKNIGIGDIKLIGACGWVIGINIGMLGLFIALAISLLWCMVKKISQSASFPFAPFLCIGFTLGYGLKLVFV